MTVRGSLATGMALISWLVVSCGRNEPREPDLPERADVWVPSVTLDGDSKANYIGKTQDYLIMTVTTVKDVDAPPRIFVGDELEGLRIGAIKCSFFQRDASYGGKQFMWRGRWGCQVGRNKNEVENAVAENGKKRFDYLYVAPASLKE